MKNSIDKLAHKYALNIKQIRGQDPPKISDFKNINKNFYDDIENSNKTIQADQKLLKKLKDNSLKELIYTHKQIPDIWKNNNTYQEDFIKILLKDKNLLSYIGTKNLENKILPPLFDNKNKTLSVEQKENPHITQRYSIKKKIFNNNNFENKKNYISFSENENNFTDNSNINNNYRNSISNNVNSRNKRSLEKNDNLSEKELNNLLDDLKTSYPIQQKLQELSKSKNIFNNLNDTANFTKNAFINGSTTSSLMSSPFKFNKLKITKRQKTFRENIFNNLRPSINKFLFSPDLSRNKRYDITFNNNKEYNLKSINNEITDPVLKKIIESINFSGPYFAFCPCCRNKNVNYYKNLESNNCYEIIHFIKKMKKQNNAILNGNRKESVSPNKKLTLIDETRESDIKISNRRNIGEESLELENLDKFDSLAK